jgi:Alpha/beta hydrolase family
MLSDFVLVAGPLVGSSSWEPTARQLRDGGRRAYVPDVLTAYGTPPPWSQWTSHLINLIPGGNEPILVGHSSAGALVADLASKLATRGLIIVDGDIPPAIGAAPPVRSALRKFIGGLAGPDGMLPPWSNWFLDDQPRASLVGIDILARDPVALAQFERELPQMNISWFDDTIDLAGWDHVPSGYVQTSAIYDHAAAEAMRRGWPLQRLDGTHLHPTIQPSETAAAILAIADQLM